MKGCPVCLNENYGAAFSVCIKFIKVNVDDSKLEIRYLGDEIRYLCDGIRYWRLGIRYSCDGIRYSCVRIRYSCEEIR